MRTSRKKTGSPASENTEDRGSTDLGKATIYFTMTVPSNSRQHFGVVSASPSSFPMRQSSIVNTFKQQQRINLVRMMFHEPSSTLPMYHQLSHRARTSPRTPSQISYSCQDSCCKQLEDSSDFNQSHVATTYRAPSLSVRLKSGNFNKQPHSRSLTPASQSQSLLRTYIHCNLQYKNNMDNLESSTFHNDTNIFTKKTEQYVTIYHSQSPRENGNNKTAKQYVTEGEEDLVKSVKLHKKEQEKNKLIRERLEYYKRTHHILNYYLNEDKDVADSESTLRLNTPLIDCFLTSSGKRTPSPGNQISNRISKCSHR